MKKSKLRLIIKEELFKEDWKENLKGIKIKKTKDSDGDYIFNFIDANNKLISRYEPESNFIIVNTEDMKSYFQSIFKILGIHGREDKQGGEGKVTNYILSDSGNMKYLKSILKNI